MTHDELLAEINKDIDQAAWVKDYYPVKMLQALRAVVELHKPRTDEKVCPLCSKKRFWVAYPCETIQAIQKELA